MDPPKTSAIVAKRSGLRNLVPENPMPAREGAWPEAACLGLAAGMRGVLAVGDVHGRDALFAPFCAMAEEEGLLLVSLGDLVDRGEEVATVLARMLALIENGRGLWLRSNHDERLLRHLQRPRDVRDAELESTLDQLARSPGGEGLKAGVLRHYPRMPYVLRLGPALLVHGALSPEMLPPRARLDRRSRALALYGETEGRDERGYPRRIYRWLDRLPAPLLVIAGHDPLSGRTLYLRCGKGGAQLLHLDSGAGQGGPLSAARLDREGRLLELWQVIPGDPRPRSAPLAPWPVREA